MCMNKSTAIILTRWLSCYLYYDCEKYPLSPLKPRSLAFIEQYLPNISDAVFSVHQSFMWFMWLNWRKSTFYPISAPNDSKCWPIVTSLIQEPAASHCDVSMTNCFRVVSMDAFLAQWCCGQWLNEFVKDTSEPSFSTLWKVSVKPWNVRQVTSWLTDQGQRARHEIYLRHFKRNRKLTTAQWATGSTSYLNFFFLFFFILWPPCFNTAHW